jgi:hypothetical protein
MSSRVCCVVLAGLVGAVAVNNSYKKPKPKKIDVKIDVKKIYRRSDGTTTTNIGDIY